MILDPEKRFRGLPLITEYIDGRRWRLARDVAYRIQAGPYRDRLSTVRAGFVFDWASVPRVFERLFPRAGDTNQPWGIAALWHDWLYRHQRINGIPIQRATADRLFREIMLYVGVPAWKAAVFYRAVRAASWLWWQKRRRTAFQPPGGMKTRPRGGSSICNSAQAFCTGSPDAGRTPKNGEKRPCPETARINAAI